MKLDGSESKKDLRRIIAGLRQREEHAFARLEELKRAVADYHQFDRIPCGCRDEGRCFGCRMLIAAGLRAPG